MSSQDDVHDPASYEEDSSRMVVTVVSCLLALATVAVGLRIYTRWFLIKSPGPDDYAAIITLLFIGGCASFVLNETRFGLGRHVWAVPEDKMPKFLLNLFLSIVLYNMSLAAVKATFLLQYNRIFATASRSRRLIFILSTVFVISWAIAQLGVAIFNCQPIHKFWDQEVPGYCMPYLPFWYINGIGNIITDVIIVALPLPILKNLKLRTAQKILLLAIFSLGFFVSAISIIRMVYIDISSDPTWRNVAAALWSITEITIGIVCATMPTLRPLASCLIPGYLSSVEYSYSSRSAWISRQNKGHNASEKAAQVHLNSDELELARLDTGPDTQRGSTERSTIGAPDHSMTPEPPLVPLPPRGNRAFSGYHEPVTTTIGTDCLERRDMLHSSRSGCIAVKHDVVVTETLNR